MFGNRKVIALLSLSFFCVILYAWFSFQSGCFGDLKTGTIGDPDKALETQNSSMKYFWGAIFFSVLSLIFSYREKKLIRVVSAFWMLFLFPIIFIASFYFENLGFYNCLN